MKIAIIGTGISGLGAAYLLNRAHDITVYEKNDYIGGHSRTIHIPVDGKTIPVDTGFIVYNERNYPLLVSLFKALQVPVIKSDMSFGVSVASGWLEYGSKNMLSQIRNIFRPKFWGMILDILKFNRMADKHPEIYEGKNLGEYLDYLGLGKWFRQYYLQAMGAAIWSCSIETILSFPAKSFITFFKNHGLLTVNDHPQWYTVDGGSREYVSRLSASFKNKIRFNCPVQSVVRLNGKVVVTDKLGNTTEYDHVVFACHADEALKIIGDRTSDEQDVLGAFQYQSNRVVVHTDTSFMPKCHGAWASWVYLSDSSIDEKPVVSLSYWMNNLQNLKTDTPVIVTLNPGREPDKKTILDEHNFTHPVFTNSTYIAQEKIESIQGDNQYWFCGAYQRYGFHEDGLLSAVNMVKKMGVDVSWTA
jgi:predicted NAD/FAD-binding protein